MTTPYPDPFDCAQGSEGPGCGQAATGALEHAEAHDLPPLEMTLAADAATSAREFGESEESWVLRKQHLAGSPALADRPYAAGDRLEQAIATLKAAGLWPW